MARVEAPRSFKYRQRSRDSVRERANMRGGDFDSIIKSKYKVYKIRDGKNLIRILPPTWDNAEHYGYDLFINYNVGVDNQSYLSLSKMKGEADPLAEARKEAERDGDKKLAKDLQPRQRVAMWIVDRQDEDEGPQLFLCPFTLDKAIAGASFDEDTKEVIYVDDPDQGCDVRFYKEGSGLNTDYPGEKIKIMKPSALHEDMAVQKEWETFVQENPIPECLQFYEYDHIASVFNGQIGKPAQATSTEDEDEKPRRRTTSQRDDEDEKPRRARRDEDEDEKPRSTKRTDDDDDEDDPPFDKDEEPKASPRQSIRERLQNRRTVTADEED